MRPVYNERRNAVAGTSSWKGKLQGPVLAHTQPTELREMSPRLSRRPHANQLEMNANRRFITAGPNLICPDKEDERAPLEADKFVWSAATASVHCRIRPAFSTACSNKRLRKKSSRSVFSLRDGATTELQLCGFTNKRVSYIHSVYTYVCIGTARKGI